MNRTRVADWLGRNGWQVFLVAATLAVTVLVVVHTALADGRDPLHTYRAEPRAVDPPIESMTALSCSDCRGNRAARMVKVTLGAQRMALCERGRVVGLSPVTTGRVAFGEGTPVGAWRIVSRETDRYLSGPGYRVFVEYWLPFFGDFGFHDSAWQRFAYGDEMLYRTRGSRGCVHVPRAAMVALFRWVRVGTPMTIVA